MLPLSQPRRILTVTGTSTAFTTASAMAAALSGSRISAAPLPWAATLWTGQPMLISRISAPETATAICAACAISSGTLPKICTTPGFSFGARRSSVLLFSSS